MVAVCTVEVLRAVQDMLKPSRCEPASFTLIFQPSAAKMPSLMSTRPHARGWLSFSCRYGTFGQRPTRIASIRRLSLVTVAPISNSHQNVQYYSLGMCGAYTLSRIINDVSTPMAAATAGWLHIIILAVVPPAHPQSWPCCWHQGALISLPCCGARPSPACLTPQRALQRPHHIFRSFASWSHNSAKLGVGLIFVSPPAVRRA